MSVLSFPLRVNPKYTKLFGFCYIKPIFNLFHIGSIMLKPSFFFNTISSNALKGFRSGWNISPSLIYDLINVMYFHWLLLYDFASVFSHHCFRLFNTVSFSLYELAPHY